MIDYTSQVNMDIDWFFANNNNVGFIASCCGKIPDSIPNFDTINLVRNYLYSLPEISEALFVNKIDGRLDDFIFWSKRGLYSYCKVDINNLVDTKYTLITRPSQPLVISELSIGIKEVLLKTIYTASNIVDCNDIDIECIK